jgi:hypothetical protein
MLKFLKSIFAPREIVKEDVSLQNLAVWYNDKAVRHFSGSKDLLFEQYHVINATLQEIGNEVKLLATADVSDSDKIEVRVKQIVLGQRSNFVRQMTKFVENFTNNVPKDFSMETAIEFCEQAEFMLDELSKNTMKSFHASQHLFHEHVNKIGKAITEVSNSVKSIRQELREKKSNRIKQLRIMINDLLEKNSSKELLIKALDEKRQEKAEKVKLRNSVMDKIIQLQKSKVYNKFLVANDEVEFANKELHEVEENIVLLFQPLLKALKKFERITVVEQKLIVQYGEDSLQALKEDNEFKVLRILESLQKNIEAGSVELKEKDKEKALMRIKDITKDVLRQKQDLLSIKQKKYSEAKKKVDLYPVLQEKMKLENELEEARRAVKQAEEEVEALERRSLINYSELQTKVEDEIRDLLYYEVNVN